MSISFLLHMILNYCGYLTLLPTIFTCRHKESNKHQNLIKTNKRNSMKNMVISSAPLYYYILIKKKNLWLLTCNDISRKKNLRETDRKRGEKSETTITQCQKDSEVIVLQRMSSFPTCSVKYLPNYLLILTRRSLLIIWPAFTSYYFYWPDGVSLVILWRLSCPEFSNCRMPNRIFAAEWSLVLQTTFVPYHKVS